MFQAFRIFCEAYGIKHILNVVATPRANGQRMIQQDNCALAITTAGQDTKDWDEAVKQVQSALNTIHSKSTIPMKALIGCETRGVAEAPSYLKSKIFSSDWSWTNCARMLKCILIGINRSQKSNTIDHAAPPSER